MKWTNKGHEYDSIGHLLAGKKNMVIYGAGILGIELYKLVDSLNEHLKWNIVFADADKAKQAETIPGVAGLSPEEIGDLNAGDTFVVVCSFHPRSREEMFATIGRFGYENMVNAFEHDFFLYNYLSIHFIYELEKVYISSLNIVPSTVCNLNCEGCLNFNPFIKKHVTYSLDSLKADCDALFSAIDLIGRFQVTGGEPFLFPEIKELLSYIHGNYGEKIKRFEIVTNGTVVPDDDLCASLNENNVYVFLDDYRDSVPQAEKHYEAIRDKFHAFQVTYQENPVPEWFDLQPTQKPKSLSESELIDFFDFCGCPWATIWNKSLSSCNYSLYAAKAGIVEYDADNYFDLTDISTPARKKELVEFRLRHNNKGYVELCRQCSGFSTINKTKLKPARQIKRTDTTAAGEAIHG